MHGTDSGRPIDTPQSEEPQWEGQPMRRRAAAMRMLVVFVMIGSLISLVPSAPAVSAATADRIITNADKDLAGGFTVPAGQTWAFDPRASTTIEVKGNVVVYGTLQMRPANASVQHTLQFAGIKEKAFVGAKAGQRLPVATDIGLWVLNNGALDVQGTAKVPWAYSYQSSWRGDEVRRTPVTKGDYTSFPTVTATPSANRLGYRPELLNLTRNVTIQGTPGGKTHVFIQSTQRQTIRFATIRHVAPDLGGGNVRTGDHRTGRYGLHLHMSQNGTVGSIIEGVVIRDADNHAFVPHASHGITFRNTIAYNTVGDAYWWDESRSAMCGGVRNCNNTHNTLYDGAVAAFTHPSPYQKHTSAAFHLGEGLNNAIVNSVAVGQQGGGQNNSGFKWPAGEDGVWVFDNNVAHNNAGNGIFVWLNTKTTHVVSGFHAYHNRKSGIDHGAYGNPFVYRSLVLEGNERGAIQSHAMGAAGSDGTTDTQTWTGIDTGGTGVLTPRSKNPGARATPIRFVHCDFAKVEFNEFNDGNTKRNADGGEYDFVECGLKPGDFTLTKAAAATVIRVQDGNSAYRLTGTGTRTTIPTFHRVNPPRPAAALPIGSRVPAPNVPPPPATRAAPGTLVDVTNSVFAADIAWLAATGITKGCNPPTNDRFCPDAHVTRGQMAAFLDRALDLPAAGNHFVDDNGSTFESHIDALAASGITRGCNPPTNDRFCPEAHVTRGQMAAFLVRAYGLPAGPNRFRDTGGSVFAADIDALAQAGITLGCNPPDNDLFCPDGKVTRWADGGLPAPRPWSTPRDERGPDPCALVHRVRCRHVRRHHRLLLRARILGG